MNDPTASGPADPGGDPGQQPTEEEMRAALEEQMRNIRAADVILQTTATLINLGARRLGLAAEPGTDPSADVDLADAKLAIDGARALTSLCPPEQADQIQQALSQLQMAYAQRSGAPPEGAAGDPASGAAEPEQPSEEDQARAEARSRLWTPPGS